MIPEPQMPMGGELPMVERRGFLNRDYADLWDWRDFVGGRLGFCFGWGFVV